METPFSRTPGTPEVVAPHPIDAEAPRPHDAVARPLNDAVALPCPVAPLPPCPSDSLLSPYDDPERHQTVYDFIKETLDTTDSDLEEFEDVIFSNSPYQGNFRIGTTTFSNDPLITFKSSVGEWFVMGLDVPNTEMLESIEKVSGNNDDDSAVFFTPSFISPQFCSHQRSNNGPTKCPCLMFEKTTTNKFVLDKTLYDDLELIKQEILCGKHLGHDLLDEYRSHKAVILALTSQDKNIRYVENHAISLRRLYAIRRLYGMDKDFGQRYTVLGEFSAQFDTEWFDSLMNIVSQKIGSGLNTMKDFIKGIFSKISDVFKNFFQLFSNKMTDLLNCVLNKIYTFIWKQFKPLEFLKEGWKQDGKRKFLIAFCVLMAVIVIDILGLVSLRLAVLFCKRMESMFLKRDTTYTTDSYYTAQAPEELSPLTSIITVFGTLLAISSSELSTIAKRARDILALCNLGKTTAAIAGGLLIVAPTCLKDFVDILTQPASVREKKEIELWLTRAHAVISLSKISRVLVSERFVQWLNELYQSGRELRAKLTDPISRNLMSNGFNQILKLKTLVASFKDGAKTRRTPHSVHISGPPGIAKTLIARKIIRDVYDDPHVYVRSISDMFWSGYTNQDFIMIDEFLAATPDTNKLLGEEYLTLVSPCIFKPQMGSVDDPSVGLKGTTVSPRGVLTINNYNYTVVSGLDRDAIWRRREFVVEFKPHPNYPFINNRVDFAHMTHEEKAKVSWLLFDVYPATPHDRGSREATPIMSDLSYAQLIVFWKENLQGFERMGENVSRALGEQSNLYIDVDELLEEEMRNMYNIPNKPQNIKEAIAKLIGDLSFRSETTEEDDPELHAQAPPEPSGSNERMNNVTPPTCFEDESDENHSLPIEPLTGSQSRNIVKWKKWVKECRKDGTTPTRKRRLFAQIDSGYNAAFLGKHFYENQAKELYMSSGIGSNYETAEEENVDIELPRQCDIIADVAHTNIDLDRPHRHVCTVCARGFGHTHDRSLINHPVVCNDCASYQERLCSSRPIKYVNQQPQIHDRTDLIPDDIIDDFGLYCLEEHEVVELRNRISQSFVLYYYDYIMSDNTIYETEPPFGIIKKKFTNTLIYTVGFGLALFYSIRGLRALIRSLSGEQEEEETICFSQSPGRDKHPQPRNAIRPRAFRQYKQQASAVNYVTLEIRGVSFVALPLVRTTMMTYEHSFAFLSMDKDGSEPITFIYNGHREVHQLRSLQIISEPEADLLFITLPRTTRMNSFPNNINRFWTDFDVKNFENVAGVLETTEQTHAVRIRLILNRSYTSTTRRRTLAQALGYQANTKKGDCGSVLIATMGPLAGRFLGMHVAGGEGAGGFFGMSTIVTKETLEEALSFKGIEVPEIEFSVQGVQFEGPNLSRIERIPKEEVVHLSRRSKIKPSAISPFLPWTPQKHLPIMDASDPRCDGEDPVVNMLNDTLSVTQPEVDKKNLKVVLDDMKHYYRHHLEWPIGRRLLSIEEALGGIPGLLSSLKVNSSAGYPLVRFSRQRGKRDWFYFDDDGQLVINDCFRAMVNGFLEQLNDPRKTPKDIEGRFLVYLKDELTTQKKIDEKRCRLIFGGDLIANTAFRMLFGSFIVAIQRSYRRTPSAIGLNQYSLDMELIYQYLIEVGENFIAGDFKNFDKKMVKEFQLAGYELIITLCDFIPRQILDKFVYHQTESPLQVFNQKLYLKSSHFSGCFFTTILNVFVHEAYIRYVFRNLCPGFVFEDHIRMKILGDDHIYSVSELVKDRINPVSIAQELGKIGQTYTSDDKTRPLDYEHRPFTDITFLGAHPIEHEGQYVGALKKDTLRESILWTRNHNNTILQECKTAMELMSVWGPEDYNQYYSDVNKALSDAGYDPIVMPSQSTMIDIVAKRTAASDCSFPYMLFAQGDDAIRSEFGLTKLNERHTLQSTMLNNSNVSNQLSQKAMSETPMDLSFSTESNVWRDDFTWLASQPAGTAIYSIDVPFGLLTLGDPDNIQNMPFDRYTYWTGDVEVSLQINGQPFQQGLLAMYFMPLASYEAELANITTTNHVLLTPGESSTASLMVPFIYPRTLMNTYAGATESLGKIFVTPLAALQSTAGGSLNISVFSRFPNSQFRIPKVNVDLVKHHKLMYTTPHGTQLFMNFPSNFFKKKRVIRGVQDDDVQYEAQGAGQSTTVSNTYYNAAGGVMPIQDNPTNIGMDMQQQIEADLKADVSAMPLDNPPLCSGALPFHQTFSGMAASHGVRPTNDLQLFPSALSREPLQIFNPVESKISTLLGKKCLLTSFEVSTASAVGTLLYSVQLNTRMGMVEGSGIPFNVALINQFMFWKANLRFEVVAVRTRFHSTRLNAVVTYGAPASSEALRTVAFSHMIDFSGENSKFDFDIEWNAQTEFLRTYEGEGQVDIVQNYSLGNLSFYLTNALVAPESVEQTHRVLVFLRFDEPRVAVPRPYSPFVFNGYSEVAQDFTVMTITSGTSVPLSSVAPGPTFIVITAKSGLSFNPAIPMNGSYSASGAITLRYRDSDNNLLGTIFSTVNTVALTDTTVTLTIMIVSVPPGSVSTNSTLSFESITILDTLTDSTDRVKYHAQGEDIPPNQEDGVQPQDESVDANPTTHDVIRPRPLIPCKLEIGRKFEFLISDIHEIGRRYHKIKLVANTDLDQFVVSSSVTSSGETVNFVNFSVQVQSYLRAFFAVWAGSVKYRFFNLDNNVGNVMFVPYINTENRICVPIIDALKGEAFTYDDEALTSLSSVSAPLARERLYPISGRQFIDVSAPFQTHFNFCYNSKTQDIAPISSGTMALSYGDSEPEVYTAFGDDLRLGVFRPPQTTRLSLTGYKNGVGGFFEPVVLKKHPVHFKKNPTPGVVLAAKPAEPASNATGAQGAKIK